MVSEAMARQIRIVVGRASVDAKEEQDQIVLVFYSLHGKYNIIKLPVSALARQVDRAELALAIAIQRHHVLVEDSHPPLLLNLDGLINKLTSALQDSRAGDHVHVDISAIGRRESRALAHVMVDALKVNRRARVTRGVALAAHTHFHLEAAHLVHLVRLFHTTRVS